MIKSMYSHFDHCVVRFEEEFLSIPEEGETKEQISEAKDGSSRDARKVDDGQNHPKSVPGLIQKTKGACRK